MWKPDPVPSAVSRGIAGLTAATPLPPSLPFSRGHNLFTDKECHWGAPRAAFFSEAGNTDVASAPAVAFFLLERSQAVAAIGHHGQSRLLASDPNPWHSEPGLRAWPSRTSISRGSQKCRIPGSIPDPVTPSLHFSRIPGDPYAHKEGLSLRRPVLHRFICLPSASGEDSQEMPQALHSWLVPWPLRSLPSVLVWRCKPFDFMFRCPFILNCWSLGKEINICPQAIPFWGPVSKEEKDWRILLASATACKAANLVGQRRLSDDDWSVQIPLEKARQRFLPQACLFIPPLTRRTQKPLGPASKRAILCRRLLRGICNKGFLKINSSSLTLEWVGGLKKKRLKQN